MKATGRTRYRRSQRCIARFAWAGLTIIALVVSECLPITYASLHHKADASTAVASEPMRTLATTSAGRFASDTLARLPLCFEACDKRSPELFLARTNESTVYLSATEATLALRATAGVGRLGRVADLGLTRNARSPQANEQLPEPRRDRAAPRPPSTATVRMQLIGANRRARVVGENQLATRTSYFIGKDASYWRTNVANYERVKVEQVYRGIDVVYYGSGQQLEYDLIVAPGADPGAIRLAFDGANNISVDGSGDLVLQTSAGELRQHKPRVNQENGGVKREIPGHYVMRSKHEIGFQLAAYDKAWPLVIDPVLSYVALLANGGASAIAVDAAGNIYVTGSAVPVGFPTTTGAFQTNPGGGNCAEMVCNDAFVTKLNPAGTALVYSTYLGGGGPDSGNGIAIDALGNAYVTGTTYAKDFPTTPGAFQTVFNAGNAGGNSFVDAFVAKLNPSGSALVYSTYLGGSDNDHGLAIAVDPSGNACVTGDTLSADYPTTGDTPQPVFIGGTCIQGDAAFRCTDAFVTKLNASGSGLVYSSFLGGNNADQGTGIAVDASGSAYVAGVTSSANFPTTPGALQTIYRGYLSFGHAFVTKLNPTGSTFVYSTYLGGSGRDFAKGIAVDSAGNAYVTGATNSTDFPVTPGAFQAASASSYFFKSTNAGSNWTNASTGLPSDVGLASLVIDPAAPTTLYGGTGWGLYKSIDGGASWSATRLVNIDVLALAIDLRSPSTLYVGTSRIFGADIFKTTDGGASWRDIVLSRDFFVSTVTGVVIDPQDSSIIYASTNASGQRNVHQGVFKSTDGGSSWISVSEGLPDNIYAVGALAINPLDPSTLYAEANGLYRTTNGGGKWKPTTELPVVPSSFVIDPANPNVLYATTNVGIFRSPNGGKKWKLLNAGPPGAVFSLMVHPADPTIAYASTLDGAVYKSTNSGGSWTAISLGLTDERGALHALDPESSSTLYVQSGGGTEAFATKLNAAGSALIYSSYLGGGAADQGNAIAVDLAGNAYITGSTNSNNFPVKEALQSKRNSSQGDVANVFVTKLNAMGSSVIFSTYLGGGGYDVGQGIAVDAARNAYVTGFSRSSISLTSIVGPTRFGEGPSSDAFAVKIAGARSGLPAPNVTGISPNRGPSTGGTVVTNTGADFVPGALVRIGGVFAGGVEVVNSTTIKATTSAHEGRLQPVDVVVINPDGQSNTLINAFTYVAPPRIISVSVMGKKLIVTGEGFDSGAAILVNGEEQKTQNDESNLTSVLVAKKAGRNITPGQTVTIQVRNADGRLSDEFSFTRPVA